MSWEKLPMQWPLHLVDAVRALNERILPALAHSPKELLLGTVINTKRTGVGVGMQAHSRVRVSERGSQCKSELRLEQPLGIC